MAVVRRNTRPRAARGRADRLGRQDAPRDARRVRAAAGRDRLLLRAFRRPAALVQRPDRLREALQPPPRRAGVRARDRAQHQRLADRRASWASCASRSTRRRATRSRSRPGSSCTSTRCPTRSSTWCARTTRTTPKVRPGDIFANNDPVIGDVHNADVQTFVPIFWEGELVAWAGGVTHVLDIGASTPGGVPVGPTNRLDDGIDLPCIKIGEDDELAQWHLTRCEKQTRAPMYYLLDEKTRLAGCHMIREAVERVILEEGVDRFKDFSREVIEEGRRSFKSRIREMTVPGRYRSPSFWEITFADKEQLPARARVDTVHALGLGGADRRRRRLRARHGRHLVVGLPLDELHAVRHAGRDLGDVHADADLLGQGQRRRLPGGGDQLPGGVDRQPRPGGGLDRHRVGVPPARFHAATRARISRALQSRGFIEEVISAYSVSGNVQQGGGIDQYGNSSAIMNFEVAAQGMGAKYVLDGTETCAAMFNPEGDMGDVEMWELISPVRVPVAQGQGLHRRARPPSRRVELRVAVHGLEHALLGAPEPRHQQALLGLGPVRRLPGQRRLHPQHQGRRPDRARRARRGLSDCRRRLRGPGADGDRGRARVQARRLHHPVPVRRTATSTCR